MGTSEIGPFSGGNTAIFHRVDGSQGTIGTNATTISFNTELQPKPWVSLLSDEFTLESGVYAIEVRLPLDNTSGSENILQISAFDTGGAASIGGELTSAIGNEQRTFIFKFTISISSQTTIEIRGEASVPGFNTINGQSFPSFYSQVYFTKIG